MDCDQLQAKGKILVDALVMCIARSKVRDVVDPETIRSVIGSALGELWREGEFRLEPVWKILCQQPGLSGAQVAPPMFVFKAHEELLGVQVRLPEALAAVPKSEQARLRDGMGIKDDEFAQYLRELADLASSERAGQTLAEAGASAVTPGQTPADLEHEAAAGRARRRRRTILASALSVIALGAVGASLYVSLSSSAAPFEVGDVAAILRLDNARRVGESLNARVADPRWDKLGKDERKKLVLELADREAPKGIKNLTLTDATGRVRAVVIAPRGGRDVTIY